MDKGFLKSERSGRASVFTPLISRSDYQAAQSKSFVDRVFGGSMSAFASALCSSGISDKDLEELRNLLKKGEL